MQLKPIYQTWNHATRLVNEGKFSEALAVTQSAMESAESTAEAIYTLHITLRAITIPCGHNSIAKQLFKELSKACDRLIQEKPGLTIEEMYLVQALYWFPYFTDTPDLTRKMQAAFMELYRCE